MKKAALPDLPDLSGYKRIGVDTETYDPFLKKTGPSVRNGGHIVGISIAVDTGESWYIPFDHRDCDDPRGNLSPELYKTFKRYPNQYDPRTVKKWAKANLCNPKQQKVGANLIYDYDYLQHWGVPICGDAIDVQIAEPLINEHGRGYALNNLAMKYLNTGKEESELYQYAATRWGGKAVRDAQAKNIWRCPPEVVTAYAKSDAFLPLQVMDKQWEIICEEGLQDVFWLETNLMPLMLGMRQRGVKIDEKEYEVVLKDMEKHLLTLHNKLRVTGKGSVDIWAARSVANAFDRLSLDYPLTPKSKAPSFQAQWLQEHTHPFANMLSEARSLDKLLTTFLRGAIKKHTINGRIHCLFHQLKGDEFGTVSGRFSSSNPNLQNIPARTVIGKRIREIFIPEEGEDWFKLDYSQIEPRLTLHYAWGPVARARWEAYAADPHLDCYDLMLANCPTQLDPDYKKARSIMKTIYLGLGYGMGRDKLALTLGCSRAKVDEFFDTFHTAAPYIKQIGDKAGNTAARTGYIKTIIGRRARFPTYLPSSFEKAKNKVALDHDDAVAKWGIHVSRAYTYRAGNRLIQGGAADVMKKGMVDAHQSGVFDVLGVPLVTVHDELDMSVPRTRIAREAVLELRNIMQNAFKTKVLLVADIESGPNWGKILNWSGDEWLTA